jgi:hypothetical protein
MNLQEEISKIKRMMSINENHSNKKIIYNLDLIELGGDVWDVIESSYKNKIKKVEKNEVFSESVVKDIVWRVGELKLIPRSGGLWFGDSKEGVENFAWSVKGEKRVGKPYHINLKNPYFFADGFWHGYVEKVGYYSLGRQILMHELMSKGHDGIIINDDTWNDTGDKYSVYGKQYIVFDENDVRPA